MEYYSDHAFLEELLALRSDPWEATVPMMGGGVSEFNTNCWSFDCFGDNSIAAIPSSTTTTASSSFEDHYSLPLNNNNCSFYSPFGDHQYHELSPPEFTDSSNNKLDTPPFLSQEDYNSTMSIMDEEDQAAAAAGLVGNGPGPLHGLEEATAHPPPCKLEPIQSAPDVVPTFDMGLCPERKTSKVKKMNGQPSKNLMAERRRRKRLNDRLSMLRSVVPKISKMDRTSILGDTIDYMKELLERINSLQEEMEVGSEELRLMSIFKDVKPNEMLLRNSPKFDVERRNVDTRIEICCAAKPGLLLSTVTTLETLGLGIQQCVISCFNDFAMQASCSEELAQRGILSSEDIKQALFRNAGYGGRCL